MSDMEWDIRQSVLPHKHQGPGRKHDRRAMNGIFLGRLEEFRGVADRCDNRNVLSAISPAISRFLLGKLANQLIGSTA